MSDNQQKRNETFNKIKQSRPLALFTFVVMMIVGSMLTLALLGLLLISIWNAVVN